MFKKMLLLMTVVVLSVNGSVLAKDHWWHGGVSANVNDPANWTDRDVSTDPTTPTGVPRDIVRIGGSWGSEDLNENGILDPGEDLNGNGIIDDPVPDNIIGWGGPIGFYEYNGELINGGGVALAVNPVLSDTYVSRTGTAEGGWWFVLNAPNILTLADGAFLIMNRENCNLRNGGRLEVQGCSDTDGPSLIVAKQFRIAENGSITEAAHETSQLRIKDTGWVQMDPALDGSGAAFMIGTSDEPGTMPRGEIIIEENGRLELLPANSTPYLDFGNADPSVNQIIIRDNGELLLPGDPNTMGRVGSDNTVTSLQEMIDMGLITSDTGTLTVSGSNPTVVRLATGLGDAATYSLDTSMLPDETWAHDNGNDEWDGSAIGEGNPGGVSVVDGYLRIQETGDPRDHGFPDPGSNRKIYLTQDLGLTDTAATFLDDGATLFFTARLATEGPLDQLHPDGGGDLIDVPATGDGYLLHNEGKANINLDQAGNGLIGFSLATADENPEGVAGLVMNALNGTAPSSDVDAGEGTANVIELDPTVWHDFWVTIQADASGVGTHQVDISVDGGLAQTFIVTAGSAGTTHDGTAVLAMGVGSTGQSGALDIAALQFASGVIPAPTPMLEPIADYSFDVDASDATGHFDGTLEGDAAIVDDAERGAVLGLSADGYVSVPPALANELDNFSFTTWVNYGGDVQWAGLLGMGNATIGGTPYWDFHMRADGKLSFYGSLVDVWPGDGTAQVVTGFTIPAEWIHIGFTFTLGTGGAVYVNGVAQTLAPWNSSNDHDVSPSMIAAEIVTIGRDTFNQGTLTNTLIDDFKFYNVALSAEEVAAIYDTEQ